jgi:hypothetical protein
MEPDFRIREARLSVAHSVKAALETNLNATDGKIKFFNDKIASKPPFLRPRWRWDGNIIMQFREIVCEGGQRLDIAHDCIK